MRLGEPLPPSRFPAVLAVVIGLGALGILGLVVFSGIRS
jgi:hypothetical protein